jgi:vitamin B12 transporter
MSLPQTARALLTALLLCLTTTSTADVIEEVLVTASHQPQTLNQIGSAISRIDADELSTHTSTNASDLLRNVAGISVNQSGPVGALTQVRMRGAEANHTLVLIDGVRVNDVSLGSEFNFANVTNADISHIEVLRGPQSARYGSDAIGGVIGIFTREADSTGWHGQANLGLGQFNTRDLGGRLGFRSAAKDQRNWDAQLNIHRLDTDGIDASPLGDELDGFRNTHINAKARLELSATASLRVNLRQVNTQSEGDKQDFDFPTTPTQGLIVDADERVDSQQRHVHLAYSQTVGDWQYDAAMTRSQSSTDYLTNGARARGLRGERLLLDLQGSRSFAVGVTDQSVNFGIQSEQRDFANIYVGYDVANYQADDAQNSLFAEYLVNLDQTYMGLSIRRDWNDRFANATTTRGTVSHILLRSDSARSRLHFSFGQGITNPSFFELFGFAPATFIGNPDLKPEQSNSFDLGWSQSFAANIAGQDTRWNVDVTYFAADLQNEITTIYDSNFMSTPINLETDSKRSGVEVSADANFGENWQLGAAYTRLRARENRIEEVRRPRHSGQIRLSRNFADNRGRASIQFLHNGRRTDSEFIYATPETRVDLQPYTLTNVGVSFELQPNLILSARADNLTGTEYQQVFGYNSPGRSVSLGVKLNLD